MTGTGGRFDVAPAVRIQLPPPYSLQPTYLLRDLFGIGRKSGQFEDLAAPETAGFDRHLENFGDFSLSRFLLAARRSPSHPFIQGSVRLYFRCWPRFAKQTRSRWLRRNTKLLCPKFSEAHCCDCWRRRKRIST